MLHDLWFQLRAALRRRSVEDDLDEEVRFHLDRETAKHVAQGVPPAEARRRAQLAFGPLDVVKDGGRQARGLRLSDALTRDLRYGARMLRKAPGFAAVAILTLALGIGATTAIFSVVNGVLLKALPFEDQQRLVGVWNRTQTANEIPLSPAQYFTFRDENRVFEDIGIFFASSASVTGLAGPEQVAAINVTAGLLPLLRVQPVIGRRFTEEDDSPGAAQTIMLSHAYWRRQFGADPGAIGTTLRVNGLPLEIIGVLPPAFALPRQDASIYVPFRLDRSRMMGLRGPYTFLAIARLSRGATIEQASTDVERLLPLAGVPVDSPLAAYARPLKQDFVGHIGPALWVLLGTVGIVLLIGCANVANLFLVRAEGRQQEVAVRTAMGAARGQIARQFLLESLVLGLFGGLAGLGLALAGVRLLMWMGPESLPRLNEISVDPTVLAFTLGISLLSGLLSGLFPVFRLRGLDLVSSLKEGGRGGSVGNDRQRARNMLVVAQMALALVLLAGSGLMIRSFQALRDVDPGFANPEEVLTFRVEIPAAELEDLADVASAYEEMWRRLQAIPGVTSVGGSTSLTMDGQWRAQGLTSRSLANLPILIEDDSLDSGQPVGVPLFKWVTGRYFETMHNPVLAGRPIEWADIHARAPVVVVTKNFATEHWGSPSAALGRRVAQSDSRVAQSDRSPVWREIVGVVGDVHDAGVGQPAPAVIFHPMATGNTFLQRAMSFAVRTRRPTASSLLPEVRAAVWAVNPNVPLANVQTLDDILARSMARTSFTLVMLAIAAAVALALGLVGIYGVISYIVSQRTREIGVRMALGADRRDVRRMVLRQGVILAGIGVVVGLVAAAGLTRLMSSLLYGVEATDPITFGAVAALLTAVALVGTYLPALRASRTDPLVALRFE